MTSTSIIEEDKFRGILFLNVKEDKNKGEKGKQFEMRKEEEERRKEVIKIQNIKVE